MTTVKINQGIRFWNGIGLVSSGSGYTLYIPKMNNKYIKELYREFENNFSYNSNLELAEELAYFLYERFDYESFPEAEDSLKLEAAINLEKGICKEIAAVYQILSQMFGINSRYMRGVVTRDGERYRHAWNKVKIGKKLYYADATWGTFKNYQKALREHNIKEGESIVELPKGKTKQDLI